MQSERNAGAIYNADSCKCLADKQLECLGKWVSRDK